MYSNYSNVLETRVLELVFQGPLWLCQKSYRENGPVETVGIYPLFQWWNCPVRYVRHYLRVNPIKSH